MLANTPPPPYYAVIFTSFRNESEDGYDKMAEEIQNIVVNQPGFLGMETARAHIGLTVCYWKDMESITMWSHNELHIEAKKNGKEYWYKEYKVRICRVELEY